MPLHCLYFWIFGVLSLVGKTIILASKYIFEAFVFRISYPVQHFTKCFCRQYGTYVYSHISAGLWSINVIVLEIIISVYP